MSLFGDMFEIVTAPVKIVATVAEAVTKPVAEVAKDCVDGVKDVFDDLS